MMSLEIRNWCDLPTDSQNYTASLVASYTQGELHETPQMLPVSKQEIFAKFAGAIAFIDDTFCGYIAAAQPLTHGGLVMSEVGSLWVPFKDRGQGIAHQLVTYISQSMHKEGTIPYAFCNPLSLGIFKSSGYAEAVAEAIPIQAFGLCASCPMKPKVGCCDTTLLYSGEKQ
jgi:hypothetical protein